MKKGDGSRHPLFVGRKPLQSQRRCGDREDRRLL